MDGLRASNNRPAVAAALTFPGMTPPGIVGTVSELWRFPIKSMGGERLTEAELGPEGLAGDRALALLDVASGALVSASHRDYPGLLDWHARSLAPPRRGGRPTIEVTAPTGERWTDDDPALVARLSAHFGRPVALAGARTAAFAARQAAFFAEAGVPDVAPAGALVDLCPVSVISAATVATLAGLAPASRVELRRFRMNLVVTGTAAGFPENDWVGAGLALGDAVRLDVLLPDPRCSMVSLAQGDLSRDPSLLRTIVAANSRPVGTGAPEPCAGVYATVATPGHIRAGDPVALLRA